jgi:predicted dinucleotide-binding enzyme
MRIAVLGTGMVGRALAERLDGLGHEVTVGTRDVATTLARAEPDAMGNPPFSSWAEAHPRVRVTPFAEAAAASEMIVNATSGDGSLSALTMAGEANLAGKILLDIANPLDFSAGLPPTLFVENTDSLGEQIQRTFPAPRWFKGLNTMNAFLMVDPKQLANAATSASSSLATTLLRRLPSPTCCAASGTPTSSTSATSVPLAERR